MMGEMDAVAARERGGWGGGVGVWGHVLSAGREHDFSRL